MAIVGPYLQNIIEQRNYFKKGDIVETFGPNTELTTFTIDEIYDEENNLIEIVNHPKQIVKIRINKKLEKNDIIKVKH